jgi:hypothetical protein
MEDLQARIEQLEGTAVGEGEPEPGETEEPIQDKKKVQ